jgi:hypothetical protein
MRRAPWVAVTTTLALVVVPAAAAGALRTPNGTTYRKLQFPVTEAVHYFDDFGGVRNHPGNDLMGAKLDHLVAANAGTVTFLRTDASGHSGNMLILTGTDGWKYWYIHINNDTPGTDDGANPARWRFAAGLQVGSVVTKGQFLGYMGDSGEAETTDPHLHFELHLPDDTVIDPYTSLRLAQGLSANGQCSYPTNPVSHPSTTAGRGYWTLDGPGPMLAFGGVTTYGALAAAPTAVPYVALAPTRTGDGYWVVDSAGTVRPYGDAYGYGGMQGKQFTGRIVALTATATGKGFWLLAVDGAIYRFGDAHGYGSTRAMNLTSAVVALTATATGAGYWVATADGAVFGFGDAHDYGSATALKLTVPVTAMTSTVTGNGYWLLTRDGRVLPYGDAVFYGSIPGLGWCPGSVALSLARTTAGHGYWILLGSGKVIAFGDAYRWGQPATTKAHAVTLVAPR